MIGWATGARRGPGLYSDFCAISWHSWTRAATGFESILLRVPSCALFFRYFLHVHETSSKPVWLIHTYRLPVSGNNCLESCTPLTACSLFSSNARIVHSSQTRTTPLLCTLPRFSKMSWQSYIDDQLLAVSCERSCLLHARARANDRAIRCRTALSPCLCIRYTGRLHVCVHQRP